MTVTKSMLHKRRTTPKITLSDRQKLPISQRTDVGEIVQEACSVQTGQMRKHQGPLQSGTQHMCLLQHGLRLSRG